jgi:hypothetical protein
LTAISRRSALALGVSAVGSAARRRINYLAYVRGSASSILAAGVDTHGPVKTPLWAGVIDSRDLSVPRDGVPAPAGVREHDRAVGGSNLYHDIVTVRVFRVLSAITGEPKYAGGARGYIDYFLRHARSEKTGFLAWGEHLYYDLFRDEVATDRKWHELLGWTPPWEDFWEVNPEAVRAAISALRYHYYEDKPGSLFNRHAAFDKPEHQPPGGQPWIKHAGLHAYSFMFLHQKTGDREWLAWSRAAADLYWSRRNKATNLTLSCIDDPRENSKNASSGQAMLAYWLLKAYQLNPRETEMWKRAVTLLKAYDDYAFDPAGFSYSGHISLAGKRLGDAVQPWHFAYGAPSILPYGRIAAYFARTEQDASFLEAAQRVSQIAKTTPLPEKASLRGLALAVNLSLDLYGITKQTGYLDNAKAYAAEAIDRFWVKNPVGGLFVRESGDPYYEAKVGVGDLLAGFTRLHIATNRYAGDPKLYDWSF